MKYALMLHTGKAMGSLYLTNGDIDNLKPITYDTWEAAKEAKVGLYDDSPNCEIVEYEEE